MKYVYQNPKLLFHGKRIDVFSIEAPHPKGGTVTKEVVSHPGAVVILPFLDPETLLLIRNERYVVQESLWELPAGTLEEGESPETCAARELEEETGYQADHLSPLLSFYTSPGFCNEILHVYVATGLTPTIQQLDDTEQIVVEIVPLSSALKMIQEGSIHDAKTLSALLYYVHFCKKDV